MAQAPPDLFDFLPKRPVPRHRVRRVLERFGRNKERFSFFLLLSVLAHMALFGAMAILGPPFAAAPSPAAAPDRDFEIFRKTLREVAADGRLPGRLAEVLVTVQREDLYDAFNKAPKLDGRLSEREKAAVFEMMVTEALAGFKERTGERSALEAPLGQYFGRLREPPETEPGADYSLVRIESALSGGSRLFKLAKDKERELESLTLHEKPGSGGAGPVTIQSDKGWVLTAPGDYFYRDCPYQQILAEGAGLFFAVRGFPALSPPEAKPKSTSARAGLSPKLGPATPEAANAPPSFKVIYLPNYRARDSGLPPEAFPPLELPLEKSAQVLDGLMAFADDEQVRLFDRDYLRRYAPDSPDLARLTKDFIYRNLGMVFVLTDPLSRGFDLLEEIYFDNISQDELTGYWLEHPRTRTGAEILFSLAASYEFERRAIVALDESLDAAQRVLDDPSAENYHVYNKSAKSYVLKEVYRDLAAELRRLGYPSLASVLRKYKDEQVKIYGLLMEMGGNIQSRAQFALGGLYWDEGDGGAAFRTWKDIVPSFYDWGLNQIRPLMDLTAGSPSAVSRIQDILARESAASRGALFERVQKFHKWETRSARARKSP